jgi:lysophospholipase L1-like esterase
MHPLTGVHMERRPLVAEYEQVYRDIANKYGLRLIDYTPAWQSVLADGETELQKLLLDGFNPNAQGTRKVMMPHLLQSIGFKP